MVISTKELLIGMWESKILNEQGKDKLIEILLHPERALDKAKNIMAEIQEDYNPKVKQRGYKKS